MFRIWGKEWKDNHLLRDIVIENSDPSLNRTRKVFKALEDICMAFDLGVPIWLDSTVEDFRLHSKCRVTRDNFIESIDFDYLELQVIEED